MMDEASSNQIRFDSERGAEVVGMPTVRFSENEAKKASEKEK